MSPLSPSKTILIQIILLSVLMGLCFGPTLMGMYYQWSTNPDYSHAFLIPLVVGYLIWERRDRIASARIDPFWPGLPLVILTVLFAFYGILGSDISAARISWWLMIASAVLFCYGLEMGKILSLPLVLLGFMVPLPNVINSKVLVSLKMLSTKLGAYFIRLAGFPVFIQGNIIDIGISQLQVVDACSGLRFVLPLIAIGLIYAHYFQKTLWKQVCLVLFTIPTAVVMNAIRVGMTGVLYRTWSAKIAEGFFHGFSGWAVFMLSLVLLLGLNYILNHLPPDTQQSARADIKASSQNNKTLGTRNNLRDRVGNTLPVSICVMALVSILVLKVSAGGMPRVTLLNGIDAFPMEFAGWKGVKEYMDPKVIAKSGAEEVFAATYNHDRSERVSLYLGYRGSPFLESEEFFHSPNVCLPAQGWKEREETVVEIPEVHPHFDRFVVRKMVIEQMGERHLVYFWFQTKDKVAHIIFQNRLHLALHALRHDNTSDTFVRIMTPIAKGESVDAAQARLNRFTRDMEQVLVEFLAQIVYDA